MQGDELQLQCFYRTSDPSYSEVTLVSHSSCVYTSSIIMIICKILSNNFHVAFQGGESTREEMCISFLYYYPEMDLSYCIGSQNVPEQFAEQYLRYVIIVIIFS